MGSKCKTSPGRAGGLPNERNKLNKLMRVFIPVAAACLLSVGCSRPVTQPKPGIITPAVIAAIGPVLEGTSKVVFYRPKQASGAILRWIVRENGTELGKLANGKYFVLNTTPGKHTYTVHTESSEDTNYEFEAGNTYFISSSIGMGFFVGHPHLSVSNVDDFIEAQPHLAPSKPLQ